MEGIGDQLLPGPILAVNVHRDLGSCDERGTVQKLQNARMRADDFGEFFSVPGRNGALRVVGRWRLDNRFREL